MIPGRSQDPPGLAAQVFTLCLLDVSRYVNDISRHRLVKGGRQRSGEGQGRLRDISPRRAVLIPALLGESSQSGPGTSWRTAAWDRDPLRRSKFADAGGSSARPGPSNAVGHFEWRRRCHLGARSSRRGVLAFAVAGATIGIGTGIVIGIGIGIYAERTLELGVALDDCPRSADALKGFPNSQSALPGCQPPGRTRTAVTPVVVPTYTRF